LKAIQSPGPRRVTPSGVSYWYCDTVVNSALFRTQVMRDVKWDDNLKLAEHWDFYLRLKQETNWRVAVTGDFRLIHNRLYTKDYGKYRGRGQYYEALAKKKHRIKSIEMPFWNTVTLPEFQKPNIVVMTPGHTGSSIVTKMAQEMGWNAGSNLNPFMEDREFLRLNQQVWDGESFDTEAAKRFIENLPAPWVLKDPRFCQFVEHWLPLLDKAQPLLIYLSRDPEKVKESYLARPGEPVEWAERRLERCEHWFGRWPWPKWRLDYDSLTTALSFFDPGLQGLRVEGYQKT